MEKYPLILTEILIACCAFCLSHTLILYILAGCLWGLQNPVVPPWGELLTKFLSRACCKVSSKEWQRPLPLLWFHSTRAYMPVRNSHLPNYMGSQILWLRQGSCQGTRHVVEGRNSSPLQGWLTLLFLATTSLPPIQSLYLLSKHRPHCDPPKWRNSIHVLLELCTYSPGIAHATIHQKEETHSTNASYQTLGYAITVHFYFASIFQWLVKFIFSFPSGAHKRKCRWYSPEGEGRLTEIHIILTEALLPWRPDDNSSSYNSSSY